MNIKLLLKIIPIFILFIFDFSFQNFNPFELKLSEHSFYIFNNAYFPFEAFAMNKLLRLLLNLFTINLILNMFNITLTHKIYYILGIAAVFIIDLIMCYSMHTLFTNWHKVLNPFLYSPLAAIALLAWLISAKQLNKK